MLTGHQARKQFAVYLGTPQLGMLEFVQREQQQPAHALEVLLSQLEM